MATTGAVTIDLNNFGEIINNSTNIAENVTLGVSDQGDLIGLAIGVSIAVLLLFGVVFAVIAFIGRFIGAIKGVGRN